ncbi:MAG: hypothetical protein EOP09_15380, partial [Proteobacteria bacterium]
MKMNIWNRLFAMTLAFTSGLSYSAVIRQPAEQSVLANATIMAKLDQTTLAARLAPYGVTARNGVTIYRVAYLIVITSFFLAGWTVHFWGAAYLLFLFLLGCGGWLA